MISSLLTFFTGFCFEHGLSKPKSSLSLSLMDLVFNRNRLASDEKGLCLLLIFKLIKSVSIMNGIFNNYCKAIKS